MDDLIKAMTIFRKYGNPHNPFHCEHDELMVCVVDPEEVSTEDRTELDKLGFFPSSDGEYFSSFRFGSC